MNKLTLLIISAVFLFSGSLVYAKNGAGSAMPSGPQIQNQNQIQTQNEGEDSALQVNTQEQESEGEENEATGEGMPKVAAPRSEKAQEKMSEVAEQVEQLLTVKTTKGGIGEQVKQIAQEQKESQKKVDTELKKVNGRGSILKALLGPDYKALKNMSEQIAQNQLRITQLEELKTKLTFQSDITMVDEVIQLLTEQNTLLQEKIASEEKTSSLFGWLFKNFQK